MNQQLVDPIDGGLAEIDVLGLRGNILRSCECEGYLNNEVTKDEVEKWLGVQIPRIRNYLLQQPAFRNVEMIFVFSTTNTFKSDALDLVREKAAQTKKYRIEWMDRRGWTLTYQS